MEIDVEISYCTVNLSDSPDGTCYIFDVNDNNNTEKTCPGRLVYPISPQTMINEDKISYSVCKSFLHDIGLSLAANDAANQDENTVSLIPEKKVKCYHCASVVKLKDMRKHVGGHILRNTLKNQHLISTCGFCGRNDICTSDLVCSSRRGANQFYRMKSDCAYKVEFNKQPIKYSTRNKCSNGLVRCKECNVVLWKYNIKLHYNVVHNSDNIPEDFTMSDSERCAMMS